MITSLPVLSNYIMRMGRTEQSVTNVNGEVPGSSPGVPRQGGVAQLVERLNPATKYLPIRLIT